METKICGKCSVEKNVCEFYKHNRNPNIYRGQCKKCMNEQSTSYNQKNKKKVDGIKQKYVDNNKEKVKQAKKKMV